MSLSPFMLPLLYQDASCVATCQWGSTLDYSTVEDPHTPLMSIDREQHWCHFPSVSQRQRPSSGPLSGGFGLLLINLVSSVDLFSLSVVIFELWHPFATEMERVIHLRALRESGHMPEAWKVRCNRFNCCNLVALLTSKY
eukprot:scaffold606_cov20-Tisochrysis_lutea.AAC.1